MLEAVRVVAVGVLLALCSACSLEELSAGRDTGESECGGRGPGHCKNAPATSAFCADFDDVGPSFLEDTFSLSKDDAGAMTLAPGMGCGESTALSLSLEESTASGCRYMRVTKKFETSFTSATFAADLFTGVVPTGAGFTNTRMMSVFSRSASVEQCIHFLSVDEDRVRLHTQRHQVFDDYITLDTELPRGRWTRVAMTMENDGGVAVLGIRFDDLVALAPTRLEKCGAGTEFSVHVGMHCETEDARAMSADNLLVTLE